MRLLLTFLLVTFATACGQGADDASRLTDLSLALPDRTPLEASVADIKTRMNGYRLVVKPLDPACAGATAVDEVKAWDDAVVKASLAQGCDYEIWLSLGKRTDAGLAEVYFKNEAALYVAKSEIEGRAAIDRALKVKRTEEGRAIGL